AQAKRFWRRFHVLIYVDVFDIVRAWRLHRDNGDKRFNHMTATYSGIDEYVGNTPLIRLRRVSGLTGCEILGKAEFMNPAGSVKDRAAYGIITDAEAAGRLKSGATIVEGTAGNTGIGLAVIGRARGYRTVIVIPNNQSPEK